MSQVPLERHRPGIDTTPIWAARGYTATVYKVGDSGARVGGGGSEVVAAHRRNQAHCAPNPNA